MWKWLAVNWFKIIIIGVAIWIGVYSVLIFNRLTVLSDIQSDTRNISSNSDTLNRDENFGQLSNELNEIEDKLDTIDIDVATHINY